MSNFTLKSPDESVAQLAAVLTAGKNKAFLEVHEDKCFKADTWLRVGTINVHPGGQEQEEVDAPLDHAIRLGSYDWSIPSFTEISQQVDTVFRDGKKRSAEQQSKHIDKTRRALEAIVHCAVKCGFINPTFDAGCVAEMPFIRPTTVVVDTSAILQGGLDFVIRFLYPMARIKIPAIAHMEILTMADRYFSQRRAPEADIRPGALLLDHVTSQGGQRVLLRLELQTEAEIERPRLGADPLRGVVQPDSDTEDKNLGLQVIQRSFADRLILETAIHHRDRLSPDHPIMVLTADQGLARMTLAEGLHPLYFSSPPVGQVCGRTVTGTCFRPFADDAGEAPLFPIALTSILWEMACTFGSARLVTEDRSAHFAISSIGADLAWHPFHSRDDLLWTSHFPLMRPTAASPETKATSNNLKTLGSTKGTDASRPTTKITSHQNERKDKLPSAIDLPKPRATAPAVKRSPGVLTGSYRFPVASMLDLVSAFAHKEQISDQDGMRLVGLETAKRYQDYRNFLLSGQFVTKKSGALSKLPPMDEFIDAIKARDLHRLRDSFLRVPSVAAFLEEIEVGRPTTADTVRSIGRAAIPTYISLSEISCAAIDIASEGIYATPHSPPPSDFATLALDTYRALKGREEYILTGRWLEELVRRHGIHPIRARERLNEARESGLLERYTEGSTPETQFERHTMAILDINKGTPVVRSLNLYHGDFLIPGKASVSIRLEEPKK
jgi:hypothetical protein